MVNGVDEQTKFKFSGNKAMYVSKGKPWTLKFIDIDEMKIINSFELEGYSDRWKHYLSDQKLIYVTKDQKTIQVIDTNQLNSAPIQIKDPNASETDKPQMIYPLISGIRNFKVSNSQNQVSAIFAYQIKYDEQKTNAHHSMN